MIFLTAICLRLTGLFIFARASLILPSITEKDFFYLKNAKVFVEIRIGDSLVDLRESILESSLILENASDNYNEEYSSSYNFECENLEFQEFEASGMIIIVQVLENNYLNSTSFLCQNTKENIFFLKIAQSKLIDA